MLGKRDPVILEIGANDGEDSFRFLDLFPDAKLCCFEPDERAIALWRRKMSGMSATLIEAAVGSYNGEVTFHASGGSHRGRNDWHRSGSIHRPTGHLDHYPTISFERSVTVPIIRLDDWSRENAIGLVDFIWANLQGTEGDLIEGGNTQPYPIFPHRRQRRSTLRFADHACGHREASAEFRTNDPLSGSRAVQELHSAIRCWGAVLRSSFAPAAFASSKTISANAGLYSG